MILLPKKDSTPTINIIAIVPTIVGRSKTSITKFPDAEPKTDITKTRPIKYVIS